MEKGTIEEKVLNEMNRAFKEHSHYSIEKNGELSIFGPEKISPEEFYQRKRDMQLSKPLEEISERDVIISEHKGNQQKEYVIQKGEETNLIKACIDTLAKEKNKLNEDCIALKTYFIVKGGKEIICDTLLSFPKEDFQYQHIYKKLKGCGAI